MAALSDYMENALIDHIFRGQALPSLPASLYFALFTSNPTDANGGVEVAGGDYARQAVTRSLVNFAGTQSAGSTTASSGTGGTTSNNVAITYPAPTANWGVITHVAVFDALSGGNLLMHGALAQPKTVNNGDAAPAFPIGDFQFTMDN